VDCGKLVGMALGRGVAGLEFVVTPQPASDPLIASASASLIGAEILNIADI
jgi:hypothetical protein